MASSPTTVGAAATATRLSQHPHDNGWRDLYRLLAIGMSASTPQLARAAATFQQARPTGSHTHLVTLLGIAVKHSAPHHLDRLTGNEPTKLRLELLEQAIAQHWDEIEHVLSARQNSFTAVRRFLLPQVLLGAYFSQTDTTCNFADIGTGLGILPRQLNSRALYEHLSGDLSWPDGPPPFRPIVLGSRFGVDRPPMPDLAWVRACHGSSDYYDHLFNELVLTVNLPDVQFADVTYLGIDLLDSRSLSGFIHDHGINSTNLCYVLYQFEPGRREQIINTVLSAMHDPGFLIVTEPQGELTQPGCTVRVYDRTRLEPWELCTVSDGHFRGSVRPLAHYTEFMNRYPIYQW